MKEQDIRIKKETKNNIKRLLIPDIILHNSPEKNNNTDEIIIKLNNISNAPISNLMKRKLKKRKKIIKEWS